MRLALRYLDGVRQGQSLGALLGYRFEEGLLADSNLAVYIQVSRDRYARCQHAHPATAPSAPAESLAAPNVVDGLALQRDWAAQTIVWGNPLPDPGRRPKLRAARSQRPPPRRRATTRTSYLSPVHDDRSARTVAGVLPREAG